MVATASAVYSGTAEQLSALDYGTLRDLARNRVWTAAHTRLLIGSSGASHSVTTLDLGDEVEGDGETIDLHVDFSYSKGSGDTQPDFSMLYREAHGEGDPGESNLQYDVGIWMGATILTWDVPTALQGQAGRTTVFVTNSTHVSSASPATVYFASDGGLAEDETLATFVARATGFGVVDGNGATTVNLSGLTYGTKLHALILFDDISDWAADMTLDPRDPGEEVVTGTGIRLREKICVEDLLVEVEVNVDANVTGVSITHDPDPDANAAVSPGTTPFSRLFEVSAVKATPDDIVLTAPATHGVYDIVGWEVEEI